MLQHNGMTGCFQLVLLCVGVVEWITHFASMPQISSSNPVLSFMAFYVTFIVMVSFIQITLLAANRLTQLRLWLAVWLII